MTQDFKDSVQALWQCADLGGPNFAMDGSTSLLFDDVPLTLSNSDNERALIVHTDLGELPLDAAGDADRLQKILGIGLALLSTHNVLVSLRGDRLTVSGIYSYASDDFGALASILSDVVSAAQTMQGQIGKDATLISPRTTQVALDDTMIFKP
ncbi:MAG: type III secretion system chaperone [Pseudomonadota bacterium]